MELHDVLANDQHAVVLNRVTAQRGGRSVELRQVVVAHVRDGKFAEIWLHHDDQYAMDELASS